ncbi:MAG: hypothetical protein R3C53_27320 [Pirellulaceae bacterium]
MRLFSLVVASTLCAICAPAAIAGTLSSQITHNGIRDNLVDQSFSRFVDTDGSLGYSVGDVITGYLRIDTIDLDVDLPGPTNPSNGQLGIVFAAEIKTLVTGGTGVGHTYSLGAISGANVAEFGLASIMDAGMVAELGGP